jgi:hypothetical protein
MCVHKYQKSNRQDFEAGFLLRPTRHNSSLLVSFKRYQIHTQVYHKR